MIIVIVWYNGAIVPSLAPFLKKLIKNITMKSIKFYDIPSKITILTFDGDKTDLRLHDDTMYRWSAKAKRAYDKAAKEIDKKEIKGEGWQIYGGYDASGFDYWVKRMEETNYLMLTISFDTEDIPLSEIPKIDEALYQMREWAGEFEDKYNFDPSPYNQPKQ